MSGAPALKIAVAGAGGRMGGTVTAALAGARDLKLSGALLAPGDPREGNEVAAPSGLPASGVRFTTDPVAAIGGADVVIDFSLPEGTMSVLDACLDAGSPLVCGVTGLGEASRDRLREAGSTIPVLLAANMSVGVNMLIALVEQMYRLASGHLFLAAETMILKSFRDAMSPGSRRSPRNVG